MQSNPRLHARKRCLNLLILVISLIYAFIFTGPVTLWIIDIDPIGSGSSEPAASIMNPFIFLLGFVVIFAPFFSILTFIKIGSQFAYKKILNNENRKKITHQIFRFPGIHYSELLRTTELQPGQLQWHLDKLIQSRIVRKDKIENYAVYFPINMKVPDNSDYFFLKKSKLTFTILSHIKQNSGIYQSKIGHDLNLKRNTVKYHIDKLLQKNFISFAQIGRKKHLYPSQQAKISDNIN
jgi:predicted transcriptional regulator